MPKAERAVRSEEQEERVTPQSAKLVIPGLEHLAAQAAFLRVYRAGHWQGF